MDKNASEIECKWNAFQTGIEPNQICLMNSFGAYGSVYYNKEMTNDLHAHLKIKSFKTQLNTRFRVLVRMVSKQ